MVTQVMWIQSLTLSLLLMMLSGGETAADRRRQ